MENYFGCFAFSTEATRLKLPVYCRTHKRTEVIERHYSLIAQLSFVRPS
jgi:hypothetical protein